MSLPEDESATIDATAARDAVDAEGGDAENVVVLWQRRAQLG
jgi:hypothetical protein